MVRDSWKRQLAVLVVASLFFTTVATATDPATVVTGHTSYVDMSSLGSNECLAAITGLVHTQVLWFNGAPLLRKEASGSGLWVYATEHYDDTLVSPDAPSPENLVPTGKTFDFEDPNDAAVGEDGEPVWHVIEFWQLSPDGIRQVNEGITPSEHQIVRYVYGVQLSENTIQDEAVFPDAADGLGAPTHVRYNFVNVVDTCQFRGEDAGAVHHTDNYQGPLDPACQEASTNQQVGDECSPGNHPRDTPAHQHQKFDVDLFVGKAPRLRPIDTGDAEEGLPVTPPEVAP